MVLPAISTRYLIDEATQAEGATQLVLGERGFGQSWGMTRLRSRSRSRSKRRTSFTR